MRDSGPFRMPMARLPWRTVISTRRGSVKTMADTNVSNKAADISNKAADTSSAAAPAWREDEPNEVPSKDSSTALDDLGYTESFDLLPLDKLRAIADKRGVTIPWDVEKALLITELRAHQSGSMSVARVRGA